MNCSDIRKKLKHFLDDLLADDDYQAFVEHLEACTKCKDYVMTLGSLSNQLWKLGDVKVPSDLASTIIFKLKQPEQKAIKTKYTITKRSILVGSFILIFGASTLVYGIIYFKSQEYKLKIDDKPKVTTQVIKKKKPIDDRKAKLILNELNSIARSLGVTEENFTKRDQAHEEVPVKEGPLDSGETVAADPTPLHWHIRSIDDVKKEKILSTLGALNIDLGFQTSDILIFASDGEKLIRLHQGIQFDMNLIDFTKESPIISGQESRVSIYVQSRRGGSLDTIQAKTLSDNRDLFVSMEQEAAPARDIVSIHGHMVFILPKKTVLIDMIHNYGGTMDYESEELIVFEISTAKVTELMSQIRSIEGAFADFRFSDSMEGRSRNSKARMSIYVESQ